MKDETLFEAQDERPPNKQSIYGRRMNSRRLICFIRCADMGKNCYKPRMFPVVINFAPVYNNSRIFREPEASTRSR